MPWWGGIPELPPEERRGGRRRENVHVESVSISQPDAVKLVRAESALILRSRLSAELIFAIIRSSSVLIQRDRNGVLLRSPGPHNPPAPSFH